MLRTTSSVLSSKLTSSRAHVKVLVYISLETVDYGRGIIEVCANIWRRYVCASTVEGYAIPSDECVLSSVIVVVLDGL